MSTATDALLQAASNALMCMDRMLRDGEWHEPQRRADELRVAIEQAKRERDAAPREEPPADLTRAVDQRRGQR